MTRTPYHPKTSSLFVYAALNHFFRSKKSRYCRAVAILFDLKQNIFSRKIHSFFHNLCIQLFSNLAKTFSFVHPLFSFSFCRSDNKREIKRNRVGDRETSFQTNTYSNHVPKRSAPRVQQHEWRRASRTTAAVSTTIWGISNISQSTIVSAASRRCTK